MWHLNKSTIQIGNIAMDLQRCAFELYTNNEKQSYLFLNHAEKIFRTTKEAEWKKVYEKFIVRELNTDNHTDRIKKSDRILTLSNILLTSIT